MRVFVLTPEEKSALIFIVTAFLLGLATKHYRDSHPSTASAQKSYYGSSLKAPGRSVAAELTKTQHRHQPGSD